MASADTVNKIAMLDLTEDVGTVLVMCVSFYFTRIEMFSVNAKKLGFLERILFSWSSMICITFFMSKSRLGTNQNSTRINNRIMVTDKIVIIFSMPRDNIYGLVFTTTEPNEHSFAGMSFLS